LEKATREELATWMKPLRCGKVGKLLATIATTMRAFPVKWIRLPLKFMVIIDPTWPPSAHFDAVLEMPSDMF
jgi:hypothetical protein